MAYDILAYLSEHPDAQDTLQGIVEWWLLEQEIKSRISQVERALSELVVKGLVVESKKEGSQTRYRINRRKIKQIRSLLRREAGRQVQLNKRLNAAKQTLQTESDGTTPE
ncbi:MAG: hypothetical protein WAU45_01995 [Blastocatellia bacterium]